MGRSKKSSIEDFARSGIEYEEEGQLYRVMSLNEKTMNVELCCIENGLKIGVKTIPFAHLPKKIKQLVNPL